jgi:hypothetical protein
MKQKFNAPKLKNAENTKETVLQHEDILSKHTPG